MVHCHPTVRSCCIACLLVASCAAPLALAQARDALDEGRPSVSMSPSSGALDLRGMLPGEHRHGRVVVTAGDEAIGYVFGAAIEPAAAGAAVRLSVDACDGPHLGHGRLDGLRLPERPLDPLASEALCLDAELVDDPDIDEGSLHLEAVAQVRARSPRP